MFLCFIGMAEVYAGTVKVTLETPGGSSKIAVGEKFYVEIEAVNCDGQISTPTIPGARVLYSAPEATYSMSRSGSSSSSYKNVRTTLTCLAVDPGKYNFGPVIVGGTKSNSISYQIVERGGDTSGAPLQNSGPSNPSPSPSTSMPQYDPNGGPVFVGKGNEEMFMKASVSKTKAYQQEAIVYTIKLYSSYQYIKFLGATEAPKFDGFVIEESKDVSTKMDRETYNGRDYYTATIVKYIIFPQRSGRLKITGNTYTVSTDAMSYYHDPFFQTMQVKRPIQLNVTPNDLEVDVMALPPAPPEFIGAVGKFSISSSMPNQKLLTNNPGSLIYTVTGTGNIKYIKMPDLADKFPSNFEVFTPNVTIDAEVGATNVSGTAKFDYSIVPQQTGNFKIPALKFAYFDPEDGTYKMLEVKGYDVTVGQGSSSDKSQQASTFLSSLLPVGKLSKDGFSPYVYSLIYWLWFIIPALIFIISLLGYRKYLSDHEDMIGLRSKRANKMAMRRLKKAYACIKADKEMQFYDEMLAALWGYLGDKLKMPASELTRANVSDEFMKHGLQESTFKPVINLIDECEYAKYTPVSRKANMKQLYDDALTALEKVDTEYTSLLKNPSPAGSADSENNNDSNPVVDNEKNS